MKKIIFFLILLPALICSCKKNEIAGVTPEQARDTLYYIMKQWYYWYNTEPATTITSVNKGNYSDPYELLEAMRYQKLDKWSFVADYDEFNNEMSGVFVGHGIRIGLDENSVARIAMIYNNSPLYVSGVRRGWIVKQVNGYDIAPVLLSQNTTAYNNIMGPSTAGIQNTFLFEKPSGNDTTIVSQKQTFNINSVLVCDTLHLKSGIAGHIVFDSFIEPSENEFATAFSYLKNNNVNDLILDLRYNSGGFLYIAQELASYIAGNNKAGTTFAQLTYNDKMQSANEIISFINTAYPLSISRIIVITSRLTASASEAVMNGLVPDMNVISVGDTTDGKPVGMNGWSCGKKYYFWPITFKLVNSAGNGDYFDGIAPNKITDDDIKHDFRDRNEKCLNEAISYLETGGFSTKGSESFKRSPTYGEKPAWMNNLFSDKTKTK